MFLYSIYKPQTESSSSSPTHKQRNDHTSYFTISHYHHHYHGYIAPDSYRKQNCPPRNSPQVLAASWLEGPILPTNLTSAGWTSNTEAHPDEEQETKVREKSGFGFHEKSTRISLEPDVNLISWNGENGWLES